jgi:hypothetical protein
MEGSQMSLLFLIAQGALMGWVAGAAFGIDNPLFWITVVANSILLVGYGITKTYRLTTPHSSAIV